MIQFLLLIVGFWMVAKVDFPAIKQNIRFKEAEDQALYERGAGSPVVRAWIQKINEISNAITGRGIVVTSWYRKDGAFHEELNAVDVRRLSEANKAMGSEAYNEQQVRLIESRVASVGIPIAIINQGEPNEHWHIGPIKWANQS